MHESNSTTRTTAEYTKRIDQIPSGIYHCLTAFERDVLTILAGHDDPAGVEVRSELNTYYGTPVEESRVYQALTKLADKQFVNSSAQYGRTNAYQLTTQGERVLAAGKEFKLMVGSDVDE